MEQRNIKRPKQSIGILYAGTYFNPKGRNAPARRVEHFSKGFAYNGFKTTLFLPRKNNVEVLENEEFQNLNYKIVGKASRFFLMAKISFILGLISKIRSVNVLFFYDVNIDLSFVAIMGRLMGKKIIIQTSDIFSHSQGSFFKKLLHRLLDFLNPKIAHINVAISEKILNKISTVSLNSEKCIVPLMVDTNEFSLAKSSFIRNKYNLNEHSILIGYTGTFWKIYGVETLIKAFTQLATSYKNIVLVLAGPDKFSDLHDNIPELFKKYKIESKAIFTGWLKTEELIDTVSGCDIMVMPHSDHPFCQFGMPYKIAEYSSLGKAIVTTDVADIDVYYKNEQNALICKPSDTEGMKKSLESLITNKTLRKSLGENVRKTAVNQFHFTEALKPLIDKL